MAERFGRDFQASLAMSATVQTVRNSAGRMLTTLKYRPIFAPRPTAVSGREGVDTITSSRADGYRFHRIPGSGTCPAS